MPFLIFFKKNIFACFFMVFSFYTDVFVFKSVFLSLIYYLMCPWFLFSFFWMNSGDKNRYFIKFIFCIVGMITIPLSGLYLDENINKVVVNIGNDILNFEKTNGYYPADFDVLYGNDLSRKNLKFFYGYKVYYPHSAYGSLISFDMFYGKRGNYDFREKKFGKPYDSL